MAALSNTVRRHPLWWYFSLTFVLSWGCIVLAVWAYTGGLYPTPEQFQQTVPFTVPAMLLGPAVATLLLTGITAGRPGYRELWSRLKTWRVGGRWYAIALLVAPVTMGAVVMTLWTFSPDFAPRIATSGDVPGTIVTAVVLGLVVGLLEEIGWTGFAIPRARRRMSVLWTGILVGVLWGVWHFFVNFWGGGGTSGGIAAEIFLILWIVGVLVGQLTAFRVLMVWVYDRTGSILVAALMHASLSTFQFILNPLMPGVPQQIYPWGYASLAWMLVAGVAVARHAELTGRPRFTPSRVPSH